MPTNQILLIFFCLLSCESWFKSCKHRAGDLTIHNFKSSESEKGGLIFDDDNGDDDDNDNDDNDDGDNDNENNLWRY